MTQEKEPTRCDICGCTVEEGAYDIQKFKGKNVCYQCYLDAEAEIEQ